MAVFNTITTTAISEADDGLNAVVAAQGEGYAIRVYGYVLNINAAGTTQWRSGASTALSGAFEFVDGGGASAPLSSHPEVYWFQTAANEALNLNNAAGVDATGHVTWAKVAA